MNLSILIPACLLALLFFQSCQPPGEEAASEADFQKWYPEYNRYVRDWLGKQVEEIGSDLEKLEEEITTEEDPARKKKLEETKESKTKLLVRMRSRLEIGDYFQFKEKADLPDDLEWKNGSEQPEIGDPESKKGGAFRYFISSFPPTIRPFGPNSNNSFRGELYDNVEVALVELHPETGEIMPGVAKEWALSSGQKAVVFRLVREAKANARVPGEAAAVLWWVYHASDNGYPLVQTVYSGAVVPVHSVW